MDRAKSKNTKGLSHSEFQSRLRTLFRPGEAAFVLHLARCERCRDLVPKLVSLETAPAIGGYQGGFSSEEIDIFLTLARGGYLLSLADQSLASLDDLPTRELWKFLESLGPEQSELIRHLLICSYCRKRVAKTLTPKRTSSPSLSSFEQQEATA